MTDYMTESLAWAILHDARRFHIDSVVRFRAMDCLVAAYCADHPEDVLSYDRAVEAIYDILEADHV